MHATIKPAPHGRESRFQDLADFLLFPWPLCGDVSTSLLFPILFTPGERPSSFRKSGNLETEVVNLH